MTLGRFSANKLSAGIEVVLKHKRGEINYEGMWSSEYILHPLQFYIDMDPWTFVA